MLRQPFSDKLTHINRKCILISVDLIYKCLKKSSNAQRELYNLLSVEIMKVCERYCSAHQLAQDAFQNTFVAIFDKMSQWDQKKGSFEGWCYRIAVNASLAQLRKETKITFEEVDDLEVQKDLKFDLGDSLEYKDLKKIIDELPDGQRMVFNMFAIEGYSHKEIAETLSVSEGTSKSQLAKARSNLKSKYKEYFVSIE